MKNAIRILLYGALIWLAPFVIGMAIFSFIPPETALFESVMAVSMAASATTASYLFFKRTNNENILTAAIIGLVWAAIAVVLDAPWFFMNPEMKMSVPDYAADIGAAYLMIPIIASGISLALAKR